MYQDHFGLQEQAFSIAVNPRYLYMSAQHREALAHLLYGVKGGAFVMLTGEVGTGKTTIIRCLLEQLPENTEIAIVLNPMASVKEMLRVICDELHINEDNSTTDDKDLIDLLHRHLLDSYREGKNTVLLIDEAQLLSIQVLEQIRLLTNLETSTEKLLQIILVGQPELNDKVAQKELRQLSQRITARFHLTPLTLDETQYYINHRLSIAGIASAHHPFRPKMVKKIYQFTGGIPRLINILCERCLVGAYARNKSEIDTEIFNLAKREVQGNRVESHPPRNTTLKWALVGGAGSTGILIFLMTLLPFTGWQNNTEDAPKIDKYLTSQLLVAKPQNSPPDEDIEEIGSEKLKNVDLPATKDEPKKEFFIEKLVAAQAAFFEHINIETDPNNHPCWQINAQNFQCENDKFETWEDIISLNRPVILNLITPEKFSSHAVLVGIEGDYALLLTDSRQLSKIKLETLGPIWTGEVFYIWEKPKSFQEPLHIGARNATVAMVAKALQQIDNQPEPLTTNQFNGLLQNRLKTFQKNNGLNPDGILGARTLMKINEHLGKSTILNNQFL